MIVCAASTHEHSLLLLRLKRLSEVHGVVPKTTSALVEVLLLMFCDFLLNDARGFLITVK